MLLHMSKGLAFPVVVMVGLGHVPAERKEVRMGLGGRRCGW